MGKKKKDHFVSVTFLKHFAENIDTSNTRKTKIFIYRKEDKKFVPKAVTIEKHFHEKDRDGGPQGVFARKLKACEDKWNSYFGEIERMGSPSELELSSREGIACYLALLSLNNPKKSLVRLGILNEEATENEVQYLQKKWGWGKKLQTKIRDKLICLGYLHIIVEFILSRSWVVFKNNTDTKFITSDDPIIVSKNGWYIPLSKDFLLMVPIPEGEEEIREVNHRDDVQEINRMMRCNAQKICASSSNDKTIVFGEDATNT